VTNNFSTGGAQSSARRLLLGLRQAGIAARAALLQEQPAYPTPGRRALEAAGVPVLALQPPEECDPAEAVERLLEAVDAAPPAAVLFWNALTQHKLLLADALLDIPIYDVSPGEMYFESLERYFERPRPGLPYTRLRDYGARLAGVVVKYRAEAERASLLGAPVHVIPNGVPLLDPRAAGSGNGPVVFGTLARLDPRKRVDMLLLALRLAAKRLPPHELRIAGGPERSQPAHLDELKHLAQGLPVAFVGEQPEPEHFLRELDVFALVAEPAGCPNASLEAMAAGLPVVATSAGGMAEQIEDGLNGRLVGREDVSGLADALVQTGGDATLRRSMGDAARARVAEQFGMPKMIDAYVRLCLG
jgi:glycosyltransferase involved in cell wall biosynthesis